VSKPSFDQQGVEGLFAFVVAPPTVSAAPAHGVNFVNEDQAGYCDGLFKHVAHAAGADPTNISRNPSRWIAEEAASAASTNKKAVGMEELEEGARQGALGAASAADWP